MGMMSFEAAGHVLISMMIGGILGDEFVSFLG